MAAKMGSDFVKADEGIVEQWYKWVFTLNNKENPFHPAQGGKFLRKNNNNKDIFWLAAVAATTRPAYKPNNTSNLDAIVNGSEARVVFNDGEGNPVNNLPVINKRTISLNKGEIRDFYAPVSTELATEAKYPKLKGSLSELAQKIVDREDANPFIEFQHENEKIQSVDLNELKTKFRVNGETFGLPDIPKDNIFMLPPSNGDRTAAFSEFVAILKADALKPGRNTLRFGIRGNHPAAFNYEVTYEIIIA